MGSKRAMLLNGLGKTIIDNSLGKRRFVDLFAGAGYVSWFAAENTGLQVVANDLQSYSAILARAVICRTKRVDFYSQEWRDLEEFLQGEVNKNEAYLEALKLNKRDLTIEEYSKHARALCSGLGSRYPVSYAYGGYYYSPLQSILMDITLKQVEIDRSSCRVLHAALLHAASSCAASPGHTAQPFRPQGRTAHYLIESWQKDIIGYLRKAYSIIGNKHAQTTGEAYVGDAMSMLDMLDDNDIVFIDPPYSGVQYSRFYHVLEAIASGTFYPVSGAGRYAPPQVRPTSMYSTKSSSFKEMRALLEGISTRGCTVILTYPDRICSNGLSGNDILNIVKNIFKVNSKLVQSRFSTLGGGGANFTRGAYQPASELILLLEPL